MRAEKGRLTRRQKCVCFTVCSVARTEAHVKVNNGSAFRPSFIHADSHVFLHMNESF